MHRLTNVGQGQGFIHVLERQAESNQQAEVGNRRADWIGRQRVVSRQRSAKGEQTGSAGRDKGTEEQQTNGLGCRQDGQTTGSILGESGYELWESSVEIKRQSGRD